MDRLPVRGILNKCLKGIIIAELNLNRRRIIIRLANEVRLTSEISNYHRGWCEDDSPVEY